MLYDETILKVKDEVNEAVDELYTKAFENQPHEQDVLLTLEHGHFDEDFVEFADKNNLSHYLIGPGIEGLAEQTNYEFYDVYRRQLEPDRPAFLEKVKTDEDSQIRERTTIHLEMLVYLKFWESNTIIKKLYQLVNSANKQPYHWCLRIKDFPKGRNQILREEIRDKSKERCPKFYSLIDLTYSNQIRNSIGHSQYSILGRHIQLNNQKENKHHKLGAISFEEWEIYIHRVIMIYNAIIRNDKKYRRHYEQEATGKHFGLPVLIPKKDGTMKTAWYKYDETIPRWMWYEQYQKRS